MTEAHCTPYSVHPGGDKLYMDLKKTFWWPDMKKEVAEFVARCLTCQRVNGEKRRPQVGDKVLLKVSPMRGVMRFGNRGKLIQKFIDPYEILDRGSALTKVRELNNKGKCLFRQKYFDRATACYDEACKLLSLSLGTIGGEDIKLLSDLVVSLNSNLATCALKLEEYRATSYLSSMISYTFPRNVKALFRRAVAYKKLKRFLEAKLDLVEALVVEPSNKDVLRELDVVKSHLLIKENGKRV
ncbi:peptidyl-prolyl cis-trans isomerase FKBP65-like [Silene latifolia]|uniref:peptidyl-prolyl cis-trans isomerase FKBP65-like n=1 Tax=Silene latifolia TaxID=37657 RepID=UPI003D7826D7